MKAKVKTKVGDTLFEFEIEEKNDMETLHVASVLGNPPSYCHACAEGGEKNTNFFALDSNKDKEGNVYVNVVCKKCGAKAKLGQYKAGGYFWHKFEKYQKGGQSTTTETTQVKSGAEVNWDE